MKKVTYLLAGTFWQTVRLMRATASRRRPLGPVRAHRRPQHGHEQRGARALAGHVAQREEQLAVLAC